MKIKDRLDFQEKPKPVTFGAEDTVRAALEVMCARNFGSILVTDKDEKVVGIVTERDLMKRVLGENRNPDKTKLSEIMSTKIRRASLEDDLMDWVHIMSEERFRHLPIVDDDGKLINMLSQGDFVAFTYPDLYEKIKRDLKGRLGRIFQILLIVTALVTLSLIAFEL